MSPISFASSTVRDPEVRRALERLSAWFEKSPDVGYIDPQRLGRELREVPAAALLAALRHLVEERQLQIVYKVLTPAELPVGSAENEEFEYTSAEEVPPDQDFPDRLSGSTFRVDEAADVRPMFRRPRSDDDG